MKIGVNIVVGVLVLAETMPTAFEGVHLAVNVVVVDRVVGPIRKIEVLVVAAVLILIVFREVVLKPLRI